MGTGVVVALGVDEGDAVVVGEVASLTITLAGLVDPKISWDACSVGPADKA